MATDSVRSSGRVARRDRGVVLAVLCAADFLVVLDGLVVAVALPAMQRGLDIPNASLQWVVTAYVLTFGGFLLLGGRIGDLYGRWRVLLAGLGLFGAGAVLGGPLTEALGWRSVLLVNAPAALLAAAGTAWAIGEDREDGADARLDVPGAVLVTAGLALVVLALARTERLAEGGSAAAVLLPLMAGLVLLGAFARVERRSAAPLVPPEIHRAPGLRAANLLGAALPVGLGAVLFLAPSGCRTSWDFPPRGPAWPISPWLCRSSRPARSPRGSSPAPAPAPSPSSDSGCRRPAWRSWRMRRRTLRSSPTC